MAYICIRATSLDKIIADRINEIEKKEDQNIGFWSGYRAALEWLTTHTRTLGEFHSEELKP